MRLSWKTLAVHLVAIVCVSVALRAVIVALVMDNFILAIVTTFASLLFIYPIVELAISVWIISSAYSADSLKLSTIQVVIFSATVINSGWKVVDYLRWNDACQEPAHFSANESLCEVLILYSICSVPFLILGALILAAVIFTRVRGLG